MVVIINFSYTKSLHWMTCSFNTMNMGTVDFPIQSVIHTAKYTVKQQNVLIFIWKESTKTQFTPVWATFADNYRAQLCKALHLQKMKVVLSLHICFFGTHLSHLPVLTIHCICTVLKYKRNSGCARYNSLCSSPCIYTYLIWSVIGRPAGKTS